MTNLKDIERRMEGAFVTFQNELKGLRTGRASPALLEGVVVEAYGSKMPLNQMGTVSAPEPRLLVVQVWDREQAPAVEKAIRNAGLGLNPASEGQLIRVPTPELSQERRQELVKVAGKYAEQARIAVRNVRRDGMDGLKKEGISEDEQRKLSDAIQKTTDKTIAHIDEALKKKEQEILTV